MKSWTNLKPELLTDPAVKAEYDRLGPEYELANMMIRARKAQKLTQAQLAERLGVKQAMVARLESGASNPTVSTVRRVAVALGKRLTIEIR